MSSYYVKTKQQTLEQLMVSNPGFVAWAANNMRGAAQVEAEALVAAVEKVAQPLKTSGYYESSSLRLHSYECDGTVASGKCAACINQAEQAEQGETLATKLETACTKILAVAGIVDAANVARATAYFHSNGGTVEVANRVACSLVTGLFNKGRLVGDALQQAEQHAEYMSY